MTEGKATSAEINQIRSLVAGVIAEHKAHEVPALCKRLGLLEGTEEEAFKSKYSYALKRLVAVDGLFVLRIARGLVAEFSHYELTEVIAKIDERDTPPVTELTRRRIASLLGTGSLCDEMDEIEFIERVWPLKQMPPAYPDNGRGGDTRKTLSDDVWQHTVRNYDWTNRELLEALGYFTCSRAQLFRFLKALVDPLFQSSERQATLVAQINNYLRHDGYALVVSGRLSGSPLYEVRPLPRGVPADEGISAVLSSFNPENIHARWEAALERRSIDPPGAITLARTLLEDVCKWILDEAKESYRDDDDLPMLYRRLAKTLKLAPDDHTEPVFRQILGNCQSVVESLGALRNKLGDAHSPGPKRARPLPRHAELAVNLSGTMATFLISTWQARKNP